MGKKSASERRCPIVPYRRALRAMAYAGESFQGALDILQEYDFAVPMKDSHKRSQLEQRYKSYRTNALNLNQYFEFSVATTQHLGIYPFYQWVVSQEFSDDTVDERVLFVRGILSDIRDVRLRKIVCTMLRLNKGSNYKYDPVAIAKELRNPSVFVTREWSAECIQFFWDFFWDVEEIEYEDWLVYHGWMPKECKHRHYVHMLLEEGNAHKVLWKTNLLTINAETGRKDLMNDTYALAKDAVMGGDINAMMMATNAYVKLYRLNPEESKKQTEEMAQKKADDVFDNLRLAMTVKQLKEEGKTTADVGIIEPMSMADIGKHNDPSDVDEDLESFLNE